MKPEYWDIGVNLTHRRFAHDLETVIQRAHDAGVSTLVLTGTSVAASRSALALARTRPRMFATAGIHPHDAKSFDAGALAALRGLAASPEVRAIGECGLDFDRDFSPRPAQERCFAAQLELAAELGLPVFLHERAAHARFLAILREHRARLRGAVVHCFTGTGPELDAYLAADCHIGITGWICDERRGHHLRELVRRVPAERLMVETDAPFLTPRDLKPAPAGGRNEPSLLPHVGAAVARARGDSEATLAAATTRAASAFFAR
jgi:TatD DNase family protein